MAWTPEHQAAALKEGWGLFTVIDSGSTRAYLKALPEGGKFKHAVAVGQHITKQAKERSRLHVDAMTEIMASHTAAPTPKRKK